MRVIIGSPLLRLLRCKRLLKARPQWLGLHDERTAQWLMELGSHSTASAATVPVRSVLETLQQNGLVRSDQPSPTHPIPLLEGHRKPSLAFVQAVNLELTYDCNWDCGHCFQQGIRKRHAGLWLSAKASIARANAASPGCDGPASASVRRSAGSRSRSRLNRRGRPADHRPSRRGRPKAVMGVNSTTAPQRCGRGSVRGMAHGFSSLPSTPGDLSRSPAH